MVLDRPVVNDFVTSLVTKIHYCPKSLILICNILSEGWGQNKHGGNGVMLVIGNAHEPTFTKLCRSKGQRCVVVRVPSAGCVIEEMTPERIVEQFMIQGVNVRTTAKEQ